MKIRIFRQVQQTCRFFIGLLAKLHPQPPVKVPSAAVLARYLELERKAAESLSRTESLNLARLGTKLARKQADPGWHLFFKSEQAFYRDELDRQQQWLEEACQLEPENPLFRRSLGVCLAGQSQCDAALEQFGVALSVNPQDYDTLREKGAVLARIGKTEQARASLEAALKINPSDRAAQQERLALDEPAPTRLNGWDIVRSLQVDNSPKSEPDNTTELQAALFEIATGNHETAADILYRFLSRHPHREDPWLYLGLLHLLEGNAEPAREKFARALDLNQNSGQARGWQAALAVHCGRYRQARLGLEDQGSMSGPPFDWYLALARSRSGRPVIESDLYLDLLKATQKDGHWWLPHLYRLKLREDFWQQAVQQLTKKEEQRSLLLERFLNNPNPANIPLIKAFLNLSPSTRSSLTWSRALAHRLRQKADNLALSFTLKCRLPIVTVNTEEIMQVLVSLLQYSHHLGATQAEVTLDAKTGSKPKLLISIADNSTGISPVQRDILFAPLGFEPAELSIKLASAYQIITAFYGGTLKECGKRPGGLVWELSLPCE